MSHHLRRTEITGARDVLQTLLDDDLSLPAELLYGAEITPVVALRDPVGVGSRSETQPDG